LPQGSVLENSRLPIIEVNRVHVCFDEVGCSVAANNLESFFQLAAFCVGKGQWIGAL
jgi:hypothetical protein